MAGHGGGIAGRSGKRHSPGSGMAGGQASQLCSFPCTEESLGCKRPSALGPFKAERRGQPQALLSCEAAHPAGRQAAPQLVWGRGGGAEPSQGAGARGRAEGDRGERSRRQHGCGLRGARCLQHPAPPRPLTELPSSERSRLRFPCSPKLGGALGRVKSPPRRRAAGAGRGSPAPAPSPQARQQRAGRSPQRAQLRPGPGQLAPSPARQWPKSKS